MYATTSSQSEVRELAAELYSDKYRYLLTIARRNAVVGVHGASPV